MSGDALGLEVPAVETEPSKLPLFTENPRRPILGNSRLSRRHREEGPGVFICQGKSEKRSPGPSPTSYPPPKQLRLQFYSFWIRGRTLSTGKAEERDSSMTVARVTEMSAISDRSFEDAINMAVNRATQTLRNVESAWVKDQNVLIENNSIQGYKVNLAITFVLEEGEQPA